LRTRRVVLGLPRMMPLKEALPVFGVWCKTGHPRRLRNDGSDPRRTIAGLIVCCRRPPITEGQVACRMIRPDRGRCAWVAAVVNSAVVL
jgi:hypothetical protein